MELKDTNLWKFLNKGEYKDENDQKLAQKLSFNIIDICEDASTRMKEVRRRFPQYTLHDEIHLINVVDIMSKIIPPEVLSKLNPVEIALLILSAFFHDQGMVINDNEYNEIKESPEFKISIKNWELKYPNLKEIGKKLIDHNISEEEKNILEQLKIELERGHIIDFIRKNHAKRSADYVNQNLSKDKRIEINGKNISSLIARLCESHTMKTTDINEVNGFIYNQLFDKYKINMVYLAIVLRIADILDFDRDRTPEVIYKTINFTHDISIKEWNKHLSVYGKNITSDEIQYKCECEKPEYEKSVREFIKWIDYELSSCLSLLKKFPNEYSYYILNLPPKVDDTQIGPKNDLYIYQDLEFSLSYDEIIKLFIIDGLYRDKSLCVRELLQNSLDALEHKRMLFQKSGVIWDKGYVKFSHFLDENGYEILKCEDNGIGMDLNIIENYLTKVGKSYYSSPEFLEEKTYLLSDGINFNPNAMFGIGFLSCFMIGDQIKITTRRFYGVSEEIGIPYIIEINGINGMLTIRNGRIDQDSGTIIEIKRREKEILYHPYTDKIQLIPILKAYAVACKYPIYAECTIKNIENKLELSSEFPIIKTSMEEELENTITFEQDFNDINPNLEGKIRVSFLTDSNGNISLENEKVVYEKHKNIISITFKKKAEKKTINLYKINTKTCFDGIYICGDFDDRPINITQYANSINLGYVFFVLNVFSELKAPLNPDRHPISRYEDNKKWIKLSLLSSLACGRIWEKICLKLKSNPNLFWKILVIYNGTIINMREIEIWNNLRLPIKNINNEFKWINLDAIKTLHFEKIDEDYYRFKTEDNNLIEFPNEIIYWTTRISTYRILENLILSIGILKIDDNNHPVLLLKKPENDNIIPTNKGIIVDGQYRYIIPYDYNFSELISIEIPEIRKNYSYYTINRNHPLSKLVINSQFSEDLTEIEQFAHITVACLSSKTTFECLKSTDLKTTLYMKYLGSYYAYICSELPDELKPPYKIWIEKIGFIEIKSETLEKWANAENLDF